MTVFYLISNMIKWSHYTGHKAYCHYGRKSIETAKSKSLNFIIILCIVSNLSFMTVYQMNRHSNITKTYLKLA